MIRGTTAIVTDGLVLCLDAANTKSYPKSGTSWYDLSKNGNNGTLTNGPTFSTLSGGSIVFDGTNDSVVTNTAVDNTLNTCTFSAWINRTDLINQVGIFNSYTTGDSGFGLSSTYAAVGDISFGYTYLNGGNYIGRNTNANAILANNWSHVVGTWDGIFASSGFKIYINGVRSDSTSFSGGSVTAYAQSGYAMRIGSSYWSSAERGFFNGNIAQASIYNRVLSETEVLQNYNATRTRFGIS
jgi:hypothetical protein